MDVLLGIVGLLFAAALLSTPFVLHRWMTGWKTLERNYRAKHGYPPLAEQSFRWVSARFGRVESSLSVEVTTVGLWMGMPFPGSLFMRRVLIPWEDIAIEELPPVLLVKRAEISIRGYSRPVRFIGDPSASLIALCAAQATAPIKFMHSTREDADA